MEYLVALVALTAMEIVLGIDNIVFIAILVGRLPAEKRALARQLGLGLALISRILLLLTLTWILRLTEPILYLSQLGIPIEWLPEDVDGISVKDLILLSGGLFLLWNSVKEIHNKLEGEDEHGNKTTGEASFGGVLIQIAVLDIIFSLDSVITAVGMVSTADPETRTAGLAVMIAAIVLAVAVMLIFAGKVSDFVDRHPTLKMLALSFLILIGVMLIAEGIGTHFDKKYIYFAMAFSLIVEMLNMRMRGKAIAK